TLLQHYLNSTLFPYTTLFRSHLIKYFNRGVILMTRRKRRTFTDKFKKQVVLLYQKGKPHQEVNKEYDISPSAFDRWVKQYAISVSFMEKDHRSQEKVDLINRRKDNKQLKMENDILKQAALIMGRK